jgi:hypothetical protein
MTVTTKRVNLGRLHPPHDDHALIGQILYIHARKLLVVPYRRISEGYECDIVASTETTDISTDANVVNNPDTANINTRMVISAREIRSAVQTIDPTDVEMFFVVWLARAAVAMWSARNLWYKIRTLAVLARRVGTTDLILNDKMTMTVCKATQSTPPAISLLLKTLEVQYNLLMRTESPEDKRSLGEFRLVAKDLTDLTADRADKPQDLIAEKGEHK